MGDALHKTKYKKENLWGFILLVLSSKPQGAGQRSWAHYFILPLLCNSSQWTFLLAYWLWMVEQRHFCTDMDTFKIKNVKPGRGNLMDYFLKLKPQTDAPCCSWSFTHVVTFFPAEPLATCLTGMWQTQLALISLTNSFMPQQVGRKLLCDAHNGESLFSLLIRLRDWALVSHNCSRDSVRL